MGMNAQRWGDAKPVVQHLSGAVMTDLWTRRLMNVDEWLTNQLIPNQAPRETLMQCRR